MSKIRELPTEALQELVGNMCFVYATLAINAGSAATFKNTGAIIYSVGGVMCSKSALSAQAFTAGHAVQQIGETGYYVIALDASGNVKTYQGIGAIPDVENGYTPVGYIKVVATSASFTPGTTALDAAGLTVTYVNLALLG